MSTSFGIHVGNTSACLAVCKDGKTDVVANAAGDRVTPAMVGFTDTEVTVGVAAKSGRLRNPTNTITNNKRLMSGRLGQAAINKSAVDISECGEEGKYRYRVQHKGKEFWTSPMDVLKHLYMYVHEIAESHSSSTDVDRNNTVVTVPLDYTEEERAVVRQGATAAGFNVVQVISEPAAACLAHHLGQQEVSERYHCLVYRIGGVSMTASVVLVSGGCFSVVDSVSCDIGGDQITDLLVQFLGREFYQKYKVDIAEIGKRGRAKLAAAAENCKHILSTLDTSSCYVESLYDGMDFSTSVTRARFDNELSKIMTDIMSPIQTLLGRCNLSTPDIGKVVLSGGSTKVIKIQKQLASMFPDAQVLNSLAGDEVVAIGAAVQASLVTKEPTGERRPAVLAISRSLVVVSDNGDSAVLVAADTPVPARRSLQLAPPPAGITRVAVTVGWGSSDQPLAEMELTEVDEASRLVAAVHVHRDGACHFTLTDKTTGRTADAHLRTTAT